MENQNEAVREENRLRLPFRSQTLPEKNRRWDPAKRESGRTATVRRTRDESATYSNSLRSGSGRPETAARKQREKPYLRNASLLRHQTPKPRSRKFPSYQSAANGKPIPACSFIQSCRGCLQSKPAGEVIDLTRLPCSNCEQEGKTLVGMPNSRNGACEHSSQRQAP